MSDTVTEYRVLDSSGRGDGDSSKFRGVGERIRRCPGRKDRDGELREEFGKCGVSGEVGGVRPTMDSRRSSVTSGSDDPWRNTIYL